MMFLWSQGSGCQRRETKGKLLCFCVSEIREVNSKMYLLLRVILHSDKRHSLSNASLQGTHYIAFPQWEEPRPRKVGWPPQNHTTRLRVYKSLLWLVQAVREPECQPELLGFKAVCAGRRPPTGSTLLGHLSIAQQALSPLWAGISSPR